MSLGRAPFLPSYSAAAETLELRPRGFINLAGATLIRAGLYAIALQAAGIDDYSKLGKASLIASGFTSALLMASIVIIANGERQ